MLNIGKLAGDASAQYYLDTVAPGVEDYYLHAGEARGMWHGSAAVELALAGEVCGDDLMALLRGEHPATGDRLAQPQRGGERVSGFDLTFRAPKSVSLLFALGEAGTPAQVRRAHEVAVEVAIAYLEREAGFGRRRVGGAIRHLMTSGFVVTAFQHRTSRAGDPLLHTHALVANLVRGGDGRWGAVDARLLYTHAKAAGALYQAELRAQLTRRLGVEWTSVRDGVAEVEGVPAAVIRAFSQRRQQILEHMRGRGETSARAAQVATLETRRAKQPHVTPAGLLPEWRERARTLGFGPEGVAAVLGCARVGVREDDDAALCAAMLLGADGLTSHASSFTRRDVLLAVCGTLDPATPAAEIERVADAIVGHPDVVSLAQPDDSWLTATAVQDCGLELAGPDLRRFTTRELLAVEWGLVEGAKARHGTADVLPAPWAVERALAARPSLSDEQVGMCQRLLTSRDGVVVVRGHAGTGKTYALDACRHAWETSRVRVIGCALSARAAAELQAGAGITSSTLHRLLHELREPDVSGWRYDERLGEWVSSALLRLDARTVVVVDEAGMVGTRQLATLLDHAAGAGARVVLVGDDRQLPEIDAGGAFRALTERLGAAELTDNRRQEAVWEREALRQLRNGSVDAALGAYSVRGRVVTASSADEVRGRMVGDWWAAQHDRVAGDVVMVALRRADVRDLNQRARALRVAGGEVIGPERHLASGGVGVGDWVMTRHNDRRLGVCNGNRGIVAAVNVDAGSVTVRFDAAGGHARVVDLPGDYVDAGHLTLAYALTAHSAQGMTAARALVLGDEAAYREWGYVALSRGREDNRLYVVAGDRSEEVRQAGHGRDREVQSAIDSFAQSVERSRAQHLAIDLRGGPAEPPGVDRQRLRSLADADIAAELRRAARGRVPAGPHRPDPGDHRLRRAEQLEAQARHSLEAARARSNTLRARLESEGRFSRWRRGDQRQGDERTLHSGERWLPMLEERHAASAVTLATLRAQGEARLRWERECSALRVADMARGSALRDELDRRERDRVAAIAGRLAALEAAPPPYLRAALGDRPDGAAAQQAWRAAAMSLDEHRDQHRITDPDRPLGVAPSAARDAGIAREIDRAGTATHHDDASLDRKVRSPGASRGTGPASRVPELEGLIAVVRRHDVERREQARQRRLVDDHDRGQPYRPSPCPAPDVGQDPASGI